MSKELKLHNSFYYKNNRLQQIRGFCNTVIFGSSVKAAEFMHLTQASISVQISSLEECLNLKLFRKKGRSLELTEDGKRFYDYIIPVLKAVDGAYEEFIAINYRENENKLRIGAYHSAISCILPKYISRLLDKNSELDVEIENINKSDAIQKLRLHDLDMILFAFDNVPKDFKVLHIFEFKPTLLVSKKSGLAHKSIITIEDISKEHCILIDNFKILQDYTELFDKSNIKSRIKFINADWEMIRFFTKENIGVSFSMNYDTKQTDLDGMVDIDISHLFPMIRYFLCARSDASKNSITKFLNII